MGVLLLIRVCGCRSGARGGGPGALGDRPGALFAACSQYMYTHTVCVHVRYVRFGATYVSFATVTGPALCTFAAANICTCELGALQQPMHVRQRGQHSAINSSINLGLGCIYSALALLYSKKL